MMKMMRTMKNMITKILMMMTITTTTTIITNMVMERGKRREAIRK